MSSSSMIRSVTSSLRCSKIIVRQLSSSSSSVPSEAYLPTIEVTERVLSVVKSMKSVPPTVKSSATFSELDFDSLLKEEVFKKLEDEFRINFSNKESLASIDATIKYVASHPKAR